MNGAEAVGQDEPRSEARRGRGSSERASEWQALVSRLAEALGCLEEGHFLILQTREEAPYYVQFGGGGAQGMRVEAVSNRFLEGWRRLDATALARLRRLGWRPPPTSATARSTGGAASNRLFGPGRSRSSP